MVVPPPIAGLPGSRAIVGVSPPYLPSGQERVDGPRDGADLVALTSVGDPGHTRPVADQVVRHAWLQRTLDVAPVSAATIVLVRKVELEFSLATPPDWAVLPLTVQLVSESVPLLLYRPPPLGAELSLTVQFISVVNPL